MKNSISFLLYKLFQHGMENQYVPNCKAVMTYIQQTCPAVSLQPEVSPTPHSPPAYSPRVTEFQVL